MSELLNQALQALANGQEVPDPTAQAQQPEAQPPAPVVDAPAPVAEAPVVDAPAQPEATVVESPVREGFDFIPTAITVGQELPVCLGEWLRFRALRLGLESCLVFGCP